MTSSSIDVIKSTILQRQLRGLNIFGTTIDKERQAWTAVTNEEDAEVLRRFLETVELPTAAQSPALYKLLFDLFGYCRVAAAAIGKSLQTEPVFGSEMAGEINGFAFSADGIHHGVLLDEHLFTFVHLTSKVIVQLCTDHHEGGTTSFRFEREDLASHLLARTVAMDRLGEMLISYLRTGSASSAQPYRVSDMEALIASQITEGMELFAVAHECGHIFHDHLAPGGAASAPEDVDATASSAFRQTINCFTRELQADLYGLQIVLAKYNNESPNPRLMGTFGVFAFFSALELIDRALIYARHGVDIVSEEELYTGYLFNYEHAPMTHPHPYFRRMALLEWIRVHVPGYHEQCKRMDLALHRIMWGAFQLLTSRIDSELRRGAGVHGSWNSISFDLDELRARGRQKMASRPA
jgi:hypothetical protein